MRWPSVAIAVCLLLGCDPDLKMHANDLEDQVAFLEGQVHVQESEIRDLEQQIDDCQLEVQRKAVTQILADVGVDPTAPLHAVMHTNRGDVRVELLPEYAPRTVANFVGLAEGTKDWTDPRTGETRTGAPLYRDVLFHRVLPDYIVQSGDPMGTGYGDVGYTFPDELHGEIVHKEPGMVSMANSGPNTNGSQFFITLEKARHLDTKHTLFGRVIDGLEVVRAISNVPSGAEQRDRPNEPVVLRSVTIER
jgi:peptidyl-prolyl cis-trans isomerase A (cyclophilin A)